MGQTELPLSFAFTQELVSCRSSSLIVQCEGCIMLQMTDSDRATLSAVSGCRLRRSP